MSTAEIIAVLPHLSADERAEVQAKLDELAGSEWDDRGTLSAGDKRALDDALRGYQAAPDAGSEWAQVKMRIEAKLRA